MNYYLTIKIIREIEKDPKQSYRSLSKLCGVSLGSIHYCIKALVSKSYVKVKNFKNSKNKLSYAYILTPLGLSYKKNITLVFLQRKQAEYETLQKEIKELNDGLEQ